MAKKRRETKNKTGFVNRKGIPSPKDAWVCFPCIKCGAMVKENVGQKLPTLNEALENCVWTCPECGYEHSFISDLPDTLDNFPVEWRSADNEHCQNFWTAFFRMATKDTSAYWKYCAKCGRLLPFACFDKHKDWFPLERQQECKACKGIINQGLNDKRTREQLFEGTINRRIGDLLSATDNKANPKEVFDLFGGCCFKTKVKLNYKDTKSWHIDHIMPAKYFWPLTKENAALLSNEANEAKSGKWPSEFYNDKELVALSKLTGAPLELISRKEPVYNMDIDVNKAVEKLFGNVRENSHLPKLIDGLKKVLIEHDLVRALTIQNQKMLGLADYQQKLDDDTALLEYEKDQTTNQISRTYELPQIESLDMAAEPFECYKWNRFDQNIIDFFGGDKTILVGCTKNKKQKEWILSNNIYNVRLGKTKGSMEEHREMFSRTSILVLYEFGKPDKLVGYTIVGHREMNKEELKALGYPNKNPRKSYMTFTIEALDMDLSLLVNHHLIERLIEINPENEKGTPVFIEP